ncbi:MAG: hypothetical protein A2758_00090 [Candidatus Zambryskibacteria bacterium RIFCSPHIGHO2_01_FULL_49_18]|uniref:Uncharacterized protein n=2 Tax=Candidatus Zambryskiibacteriota TaxID=1817925 RepID=A0A1G2T2J2_9BACT|nr:MAG: hypothetical protein A2758_00090 [Candidatus Zambryskibacteria bacterium RIFCSPHIGHO2_01_FULL_49_18]OHB05713.1 MAG: hypothetical protein A3A26_02435 [Candidatus Zambryskibacteria bacterium RIFCSPLOWO2_01_FULL_47_14]
MTIRQISNEERQSAYRHWCEHQETLRKHGGVSEEDLRLLAMMTQPNCFGYDIDKGEVIGVGPEAKWDLLEILKQSGAADLDVCMRLAGVSDAEMQAFNREMELHSAGIDSKNAAEVEMYEGMKSMSPVELDRTIAALETRLGLKPPR